MYTYCPDCHRQYRIRAEQLSAAQGMVICGFCGRKFNALDKLHDRPRKTLLRNTEVNMPEPENMRPADAPSLRDEVGSNIFGGHLDKPARAENNEPRFDISEALLDKEQAVVGKTRSKAWAAGVLAMLLITALQIAWFNRDDVLQAYPQLTPWVAQFCEKYHCDLARRHDFSSIKLLNRDVRLHPNYADTLLVNATMANQSAQTHPFPKIQLTLFDTNGQMLAYREFAASEYLDHSIDVATGMAPWQPVHFVLEVTGPTQDAVSFEFRFL